MNSNLVGPQLCRIDFYTCVFVCVFEAVLFLTQEGEKETLSYRSQCHVSSKNGFKESEFEHLKTFFIIIFKNFNIL